ncbi:MAG: carbon storage regulator CsrA [Sarcina sp.]
MLVLSRKKGESIVIGDNIEVTVIKLDDGTVKLAVNAPKDVSIFRKELLTEVESENKAAVNVDLSLLKFVK